MLVIGVGGIVVGVVVVEPGVGRHIRAADEMLGLGSRVGPRIRIRLARLVWRRYFAAVVEWFQPVMGIEFAGFHFIAGIRFMAELAGLQTTRMACPREAPGTTQWALIL